MTAVAKDPGDGTTQTAFMTLLPMRLDQDMTLTHVVNVPSPWGSPLSMGTTGTDPGGEPVLVLVNEAPVNFLRPTQPLDDPDKWQLELLQKDRPDNNVLLISAGAPDRLGNQYPAEEILAGFYLIIPNR